MELAKAAATGSVHRVYRVNDTLFDGSSASLVDINANELILTPATGSAIDAFAPGQSVRYYVLPDTAAGQDSYPIGGLLADTLYYLIPRGGNRYAVAATIKDALANRAIDLTALGVGSQHVLHYELGSNVQVSGALVDLASSDYKETSESKAQVENVVISGSYEIGDVVAITVQDLGSPSTRPANLSYAVTSTNPSSIRDGLINLINTTVGVGTGTGSYLTAATVASNGQALSLTAKKAGSAILVTATATNGIGNATTAEIASVVSVSENYIPPNQIAKKLVLTSPPATMGRMSTVQLSSGLIQRADKSLYGAAAFLNSSNGITTNTGTVLAGTATITLKSGDIVYVETLAGGVTSGSYLRYAATSPLTKNGADLRTSLTQQASLWLVGAGPLLEIVQPTDQPGVYRLQGPSSSTNDLITAGLLSTSTAGLRFNIQTAAATFNPSTAVDDANSLITLSGFSATTGEILTIRPDATFSRSITKPSLITLNPSSITNGSNIWTEVSIPSTVTQVNGVIKATYHSVNPTLAPTGRAASSAPRGGLTEGQVVYLRQNKTTGSVSLFSDAAGSTAINLNTATTSLNTTHFFMVDVSLKESSQSVGGITPGQELNVISLGSNRYQFVESQADLEASLPLSLLGRQIKTSTSLAKVEQERPAGVSITSTIATGNEVESSTSIGTDMEEESWTDYAASGSASDAASDAMKDKISEGIENIMASLFKIPDNPASSKVEPGSSLSGAIGINLAKHNASVTLSSTGRVVAQAGGPVAISSAIEADFANSTSAETEQAAASAISVAFGLNKLTNIAENQISGSIQSDNSSVTIQSGVTYLSHFAENESFGDTAKLKTWLLPTSIDDALALQSDLSDVTGLLVGAGFNTYSTVQIHGKTEEGSDKSINSEVGVGIGINISLLTNKAINTIDGMISASNLAAKAATTIDYVRGSGQIHFDPSPETLYGVYQDGKESPESAAPSSSSTSSTTPAAKSSKSSISKAILDFGNVAKNGLGASVSVITPVNISRNTFTNRSDVTLSGALGSTAKQAGKSVGVVVGSGSSQNMGFNGGILIDTGAINTTENIMEAGAKISAVSASFIASDKIKQFDVAGSVQYSKAIAMGLSLIINDLQRKTRNVLDPSGRLSLTGADGLLAEATNSGQLVTVAVAGAISKSSSTPPSNEESTSKPGWIPEIQGFGISATGSIVVNKLANNEASTTLAKAAEGQAPITAKTIDLRAGDATKISNWGGAVAFGRRGVTTPTKGSAQENRGLASIAGTANINYVGPNVYTGLSNVDLGSTQSSVALSSSTQGASATAGAISLSVAVSSGTSLSIPGSLALNLTPGSTTTPVTKASVANVKGTAITGLSILSTEAADAGAYAGSLGLAANPLQTSSSSTSSPQVAATFGFSVAINNLQAGSLAELSGSTLTTAADAPITIRAKTSDVDLQTVSISAAGSSSQSTAGSATGSYAVAGAAAGAENKYSSPITARITGSSINAPSSGSGSRLTIEASSDEQVLAVSGGVDIAIAEGKGSGPSGAFSVGASASHNTLSGGIAALISGDSMITVDSLNLTSTDGSGIGAYAIAGSASAASGTLGTAFASSLVGAGTGNVISRSLDARIGDPNAAGIGTGVINVTDATIRASRSNQSRIVADAAGVAITAAATTSANSALSAGIAGAFSFNTISGGVTAGIHNITDFTAKGNTTIEALAERGSGGSTIDTFSGGFAVSLNQSSGGAGGLSLGLVVAKNTINDALTAKIKNVQGGADTTITTGTLAIRASNDRKINADAAGGALTISNSANTSVSLAIGAVDGKNEISGDIFAGLELGNAILSTTGNGISLDGIATSLDIFASDTAKIQVFSLAAAISMAQGTNSLSLSGGGAGATNTISSNLQAVASASTLRGTGTGRHRIRATTTKGSTTSSGDSRQIKASIAAGAAGGVAIGVSTADNKINWNSISNSSSGNGVTAKIDVASTAISGGLELASINADSIEATVASKAVGLAYSGSGIAMSIAAAGAGATNSIGTGSAAQILGRSSGAGQLQAASINLTSLDIGQIQSAVGAGSVAISFAGSGFSAAPAIGAATATNTLAGNSDASISGFTGVRSSSGDLSLRSSRELLDANGASLTTRRIDSTAAAAAVSAAIGQSSVGVAGGGASATNIILGDTTAAIASPSISSAGKISAEASSLGTINAKIIAVSAAVAAGTGGSAGAASIGVSIARNFIGATQGNAAVSGGSPTLANRGDGDRISATISGASGNPLSTMTAGGAIRVEASHNATIKAEVVAVSAAIAAASGGGAVALSGAGSEATNVIATSTNATISGNSAVGSSSSLVSTDLTIRANDAASIDATAVGASLAASFSAGAALAPSIGISLATNSIRRNSKAELANFASVLPSGNVLVSSTNNGTINSKSIAAVIAASFGSGFAAGLAGGGANSFNTITGNNQALVTNAQLGSAGTSWNGTVTVSATDTSSINAKVDTITAAGAGGANGVAAAIGVALARNFIGETQANSALSGGSPQNFTNLLGGSGNLVRAAITDSNLYAKGELSVTASNAGTISSTVDSFAAALSVTGGVSASLVGAGSEATNRSLVAIQAFLGATSGKTISLDSGAIKVSSSDTTSADTTAWGAAVGASFGGGVSGAAAIGVSLARTTLNNSTATTFQNIAAGSKAAALTVTASKAKAANRSASISAKSAAVAVALSKGSSGGSLAGGGADAINTLLGDATTTITAANLTVAGVLTLGTTNSQTADAGVGAGVGAGSATGVGGAIAVGAVKVQNLLGIATADASDNARAKVQTTIVDSNLITTGINASNPNLSASSSSTASYSALAVPVSVALTSGQFAGAFSGAFNDSRIAYDVQTTVRRANLVAAGNLAITATTDNEISRVNTDAGSIAASFGPQAGAGIAIGAAENKNRIDNINKVNIGDGASNANGTRYTVQSKGDLTINANDIRSSVTQSNATTTAVAAGIVAASGGGAGVYNTVANTIATTIAGAVDINAGIIGDGFIASATIQPVDTSIAQADQVTLGGHYNYGDVITIKLGSLSFNDTVSYTVTNLAPASILSGLIAAVNSQAGSRYTAAAVAADANSLTVTAKTVNQPFLSQASSSSAAFRAGSLTIGAASTATTLNSEIIATSVAAGLGAAVGVGVVENRVGNSVLTLTQSSAKTGGTNAPTFAASANVTIASSTADSIAQAKVITVSSGLIGAAVNSAKAIDTTTSRSQVQAGSIYTPLGTTFVQSSSINNLSSSSDGTALGGIAGLGVMFAESSLGGNASEPEVQALVGSGVSISAQNVEITSFSRDSVYADSISAAGGLLVGGAGAQSKAATNQTVQTQIGDGASIKASGSLKLSSLLDQTGEDGNSGGIDSRGEGIAVSVFGMAGGGAELTNEIYSKALLDVGSNSQLIANAIDLAAGNSLEKTKYSQPTGNGTSPNANVKVVVAGIVGGAGSKSTTSIGNDAGAFGSAISIGSGASVRATGSKASPGSLQIHADSDVFATDDGVLDAVSAVAAVSATSSVTNKAKASVSAASGSQIINESGDVIITAKGDGTISSSNSVLSGVFGFGKSSASAINTPTNSISIDGSIIKGQTIKLWSGLDGSGVPNILSSYADSQMNAGVVGIPVPEATAKSLDTNTISVTNNAQILARGNVELKAQSKDWSVTPTKRSFADATAYILLAVPIPGTTNTTDSTSNTITIDGGSKLVAGSQHQLKLFSLPYTTDLTKQNNYLNLSGSAALTSPLVKDNKLTSAQLTSLGLDGSMDYSFRLLASPLNSVVDVSNFIGVVLPDQLWLDPAQRPFLDIVDLGSDLAEDDARLSDLIATNDTSPSLIRQQAPSAGRSRLNWYACTKCVCHGHESNPVSGRPVAA